MNPGDGIAQNVTSGGGGADQPKYIDGTRYHSSVQKASRTNDTQIKYGTVGNGLRAKYLAILTKQKHLKCSLLSLFIHS